MPIFASVKSKNMEEIKLLIKRIESDKNYQLRDSIYYEPWDMDDNTKEEMADTFYYLLKECLRILKHF